MEIRRFPAYTQSKTSADIFIEYFNIIQYTEEQCGGIFTADIYLKIFEDNVLNNFDHFFYIFTDTCKISLSKNKG